MPLMELSKSIIIGSFWNTTWLSNSTADFWFKNVQAIFKFAIANHFPPIQLLEYATMWKRCHRTLWLLFCCLQTLSSENDGTCRTDDRFRDEFKEIEPFPNRDAKNINNSHFIFTRTCGIRWEKRVRPCHVICGSWIYDPGAWIVYTWVIR